MAIRASCDHCKKSFTAPEQYHGKKIECPACGRKFVLRTPEELNVVHKEAEAAEKKREEDREKLALLERLDSKGYKKGGRPYYEEFQTGSEGVRHYGVGAPTRFSRFRALSDFLVLGAYLELLLVSLGIGLVVYLGLRGTIESVPLLFLAIVIWLVIGAGLFLFLKYLGELAFLLAEVGDQQHDLVQLLRDLRDNTDTKGS